LVFSPINFLSETSTAGHNKDKKSLLTLQFTCARHGLVYYSLRGYSSYVIVQLTAVLLSFMSLGVFGFALE